MKVSTARRPSIEFALVVMGVVAAIGVMGAAGCGNSKTTASGRADFSHVPDMQAGSVDLATDEEDIGVSTDLRSEDTDGGDQTSDAGPTGCTEVTVSSFHPSQADGTQAQYVGVMAPDSGDTSDPDTVSLEFFGSTFDSSYNGETTGSFDLSTGADSNYATCSRCLSVFQDPSTPGKTFFQSSGTMVLAANSDQINGTLHTTLTNVTLVEVTVDATTFTSTPVPGGACLHITAAQIDLAAPAGWTCDAAFYSDGQYCDCGCGVADADCATADVGACDFCDDTNSCSTDSCPGTINAADNATCN